MIKAGTPDLLHVCGVYGLVVGYLDGDGSVGVAVYRVARELNVHRAATELQHTCPTGAGRCSLRLERAQADGERDGNHEAGSTRGHRPRNQAHTHNRCSALGGLGARAATTRPVRASGAAIPSGWRLATDRVRGLRRRAGATRRRSSVNSTETFVSLLRLLAARFRSRSMAGSESPAR